MLYSQDDWDQIMTSSGWGQRVSDALRSYFAEGRWLLEPAELLESSVIENGDHAPLLLAIYHHPYCGDKRVGLRRRLDRIPFAAVSPEQSPEEAVAQEIAVYEISEPLGRQVDLLVEDDAGI